MAVFLLVGALGGVLFLGWAAWRLVRRIFSHRKPRALRPAAEREAEK